jgi:lysophospholipase L1-like esterase
MTALIAIAMLAGCLHANGQAPVDVTKYPGKVKLACVGDSITQGVGAQGKPYPKQLTELLGDKWEVRNFGVSAKTMIRQPGSGWTTTPQYTQALEFKPDVVTIKLGTNDSKVPQWDQAKKDTFLADSKALVADFRKANPDAKIYVCLPVPAYPGRWGIDDGRIRNIICPLLRQVASETKVELIDTYSAATNRPDCFPDTVHPNAAGSTLIANAVFKALTGKQVPASGGAR